MINSSHFSHNSNYLCSSLKQLSFYLVISTTDVFTFGYFPVWSSKLPSKMWTFWSLGKVCIKWMSIFFHISVFESTKRSCTSLALLSVISILHFCTVFIVKERVHNSEIHCSSNACFRKARKRRLHRLMCPKFKVFLIKPFPFCHIGLINVWGVLFSRSLSAFN